MMAPVKHQPISDVAEIISGGTPSTSHGEYWGGNIPWLSVADFSTGYRWVDSAEKSISELGLLNSATTLLNKGDIIISARGTVGALAQIAAPMAFNQSCYGIRGRKGLSDTNFLYYAIKDAVTDLQHIAHGAVFSTITKNTFSLISIPQPPLPEQRRIAHILGTLDDKIENNRKTAKTLEAMAQAIFQSWFVDFDPVRAKMAGESPTSICKRLKLTPEILDLFPDRLVDSELGEIPKGWEVRSIDRIGNFLNGLAMQKFPSSGQDNLLPVIKIAQLRACDLSGADLASSEIEPQFIVHDGDILFSWSGSLECVLWSGGVGALNQHLFKVTPKSGYPRWLCYYGVRHFLEFFREVAAGKATTMGHIQRHHLSDARLALPHLKSLRGMNVSVEVAFEIIWKELVEARKLSVIRDALLPKLISGEIIVPEADHLIQATMETTL